MIRRIFLYTRTYVSWECSSVYFQLTVLRDITIRFVISLPYNANYFLSILYLRLEAVGCNQGQNISMTEPWSKYNHYKRGWEPKVSQNGLIHFPNQNNSFCLLVLLWQESLSNLDFQKSRNVKNDSKDKNGQDMQTNPLPRSSVTVFVTFNQCQYFPQKIIVLSLKLALCTDHL